ncbi:hypothetical protein B0H13DRAFT_2334556 [Mycena leptocephala]|nr:hypothetical protein B0H13DRAFT_2334556 [Mycena leptocephala]
MTLVLCEGTDTVPLPVTAVPSSVPRRRGLSSLLSAVLTARLILNMREVVDTDSMDVASVEASTVEWNDIDGIPMEDTRSHMRNRASWGYGNYFE